MKNMRDFAKCMNASKVEKLDRIIGIQARMHKTLTKKGIPERALSEEEIVTTVTRLLKKKRSGQKIDKLIVTEEDYQRLELFDRQLDYYLKDECLLCGELIIETIDMPLDSVDELQWTIIA